MNNKNEGRKKKYKIKAQTENLKNVKKNKINRLNVV
jgi:hypothetical protein